MDVIMKKATLCLLLGGILAILLLSACTSAESGNSDSIIDKSPSMGADEDNQEASEVTILSVDQPALSLSIPKAWEDIAIIKRQTDIQQSAEAKDGTLLFQLYEKTAYTTDEAMGNVWSLVAFTKDAFKEKFGDADLATVIGVESYVLGSDSDYIYLLVRPSDVQFLENDDTSLKQYKQLQQESQVVLAGFLKDNSITVNEDCPNSSCYKVAACTNRSSELPAPDSTVFGYEGETKIIFDGVCAKYNDKKEKNQVFLPIVQVLGTYEEGNITKIVSCVSLTEMSLEEGNLTIAGTNIFPMVTEIKYENEEYEVINLNSAETVLANGSASFPEVFLLICGPLEDVKQDIENRTFALPEMEKTKSREREYIEWSNVNVSTVNGDINYDEYFRLAD
jgi:hypothetical protein